MKTKVMLETMVQGINRICTIEAEGTPGKLFAGKSAEELFEKETGLKPEKLLVSVGLWIDIAGTTTGVGFETNCIETAISKGDEMAGWTERDILDDMLSKLPSVDALAIDALSALQANDMHKLEDILALYDIVKVAKEKTMQI